MNLEINEFLRKFLRNIVEKIEKKEKNRKNKNKKRGINEIKKKS